MTAAGRCLHIEPCEDIVVVLGREWRTYGIDGMATTEGVGVEARISKPKDGPTRRSASEPPVIYSQHVLSRPVKFTFRVAICPRKASQATPDFINIRTFCGLDFCPGSAQCFRNRVH